MDFLSALWKIVLKIDSLNRKFKSHPNILKNKTKISLNCEKFSFKEVSVDDIKAIIRTNKWEDPIADLEEC